jgi:amidohydrolase
VNFIEIAFDHPVRRCDVGLMQTDLPSEWQIDAGLLAEATALRHELHRRPELSGSEIETARLIAERIALLNPTELVTGLGGTGVAAAFGAGDRTLLIRCELDALPIREESGRPYSSEHPGTAHLCGHDGHMAILFAVATCLSRRPPSSRVVLLFQPAEETGDGAKAVLEDPAFATLRPNMAIALHNLPGLPLGSVALAEGPVTCASRVLTIRLKGKTAHAAQPETGHSPANALARLLPALTGLTSGLPPTDPGFRLATVTHARLGVPAGGVAPGDAEIWVTLRAVLNGDLDRLEAEARALVETEAAGFAPSFEIQEPFSHGVNDPTATALLARASTHLPRAELDLPQRFSEDFGLFGTRMPAALLFLGAGEMQPDLHNPDYDFPDALIPIGASLFLRAIMGFGNTP